MTDYLSAYVHARVDDLDLDARSHAVAWQRRNFSVELSRQISKQ